MSLASVPMEDSTYLEEVEALKAIYIREMDVSYRPSTEQPLCISINLHPATADNADEQYVCLTLIIKLPLTYPNELPEISIRNPRGLSDEDLDRITSDLLAKAKESQGNAMLFELIEMAKEHLTMDNTPRCLCAICLYEFSEQDVFTKTECYHHFHSHCLARYVESLATATLGDAPASSLVEDAPPAKILCPVCREPIRGNLDLKAPPPVHSESAAEFRVDEELKRRQATMAATFEKQKSQGGIIDIEAEKNKYLIEISTVMPSHEASETPADSLKQSHGATAASKQNRAPRNHQNGTRNAPSLDWSAASGPARDENLANGDNHYQHRQNHGDDGTNRQEGKRGYSGRNRNRHGGRIGGRGQPREHRERTQHSGGGAGGAEGGEGGGEAPRRGGRGRGTQRNAFADKNDTVRPPPLTTLENVEVETVRQIDVALDVGEKVDGPTSDDKFDSPDGVAERNGWPRGRGAGRRSFGSSGERRRGNRRQYSDGNSPSGNGVPSDDAQNRNWSNYCDNPSDGDGSKFKDHVDNCLDDGRQSGRRSQRGRRAHRQSFQGDRRGSADNSSGRQDRHYSGGDGEWGGHRGGGRGSSGSHEGSRINNRRYWSSNRNSERGGIDARNSESLSSNGAEVIDSSVTPNSDDQFPQREGGGGRGRQRHPRSGRGWSARRNGASVSENPSSDLESISKSSVDGAPHSRSPSALSSGTTAGDQGAQESRRMVLTGPPTKASFGKSRPELGLAGAIQREGGGGSSFYPAAAAQGRVNRDVQAPRQMKEHRRLPVDVSHPPPGFRVPTTDDLQSKVAAAASVSVSGPPPGFCFQRNN